MRYELKFNNFSQQTKAGLILSSLGVRILELKSNSILILEMTDKIRSSLIGYKYITIPHEDGELTSTYNDRVEELLQVNQELDSSKMIHFQLTGIDYSLLEGTALDLANKFEVVCGDNKIDHIIILDKKIISTSH